METSEGCRFSIPVFVTGYFRIFLHKDVKVTQKSDARKTHMTHSSALELNVTSAELPLASLD